MPTKNFTPKRASGVGYGDNVAVLSQAFGQPARVLQRQNAPSNDGAVQPAGLFSTAPYTGVVARAGASVSLVKIDGIREDVERDDRYGKCFGANDTCRAWGTDRYGGLCNAHGGSAEKQKQAT